MKPDVLARVKRHGERLQAIFPETAALDPVSLCRRLRRIESHLARLDTQLCNGDIGDDEHDHLTRRWLGDAIAILGAGMGGAPPIIHNSDPRGYALKIDDAIMRERGLNLHRDWGGYGIIAPDLSEAD